ncbi:hypothetical protein V8E36_007065 [Tilletia maclaganii]
MQARGQDSAAPKEPAPRARCHCYKYCTERGTVNLAEGVLVAVRTWNAHYRADLRMYNDWPAPPGAQPNRPAQLTTWVESAKLQDFKQAGSHQGPSDGTGPGASVAFGYDENRGDDAGMFDNDPMSPQSPAGPHSPQRRTPRSRSNSAPSVVSTCSSSGRSSSTSTSDRSSPSERGHDYNGEDDDDGPMEGDGEEGAESDSDAEAAATDAALGAAILVNSSPTSQSSNAFAPSMRILN